MKIREGYILKKIGGQFVGLYVGEQDDPQAGMVNMNEVGAFLWQELQKETCREELLNAVLTEYNVDAETAGRDIDSILALLQKENILE